MGRLHKLALAFAALMVLLATGCSETQNVGTVALPTWDTVSSFSVAVTVPGNARSGQAGNFSVNITGGTGPFEVTYAFDDCVTPRTTTRNITGRSDVLSVTFDEVDADTECTLVVTVEDANNRTGTRTRTFTLRPAGAADTAPTITSVTFDNDTCVATVTASDAEGDDVTINATAPAGTTVDAASKPLGAGGTVTFTFASADPFAAATGNASFTATANGLTSAASTTAINCPALELEADTLYAIPLDTTVAVGEPVRIVFATGELPNPFQFLAGLRVIVDEDAGIEYVPDSINAGAPGGAADDPDGIWADMNMTGFLLPQNIVPSNVGGFTAYDFNITPLGGEDLTDASGALFNAEFTFDAAGTWQLGFQENETVDRTYYQDQNTTPNYFWGDITNLHAGVPSAITVTP
jgi:hypothetical protein